MTRFVRVFLSYNVKFNNLFIVMSRHRTREIQQALLEQVFWRSGSPVKRVALTFGLTRQAVQQHARRLIGAGRLHGTGERFDEALLDFKGVRSIGPAFADEIFRVFAAAHPNVQLIAINANEQVTAMIRRATAARADADEGGGGGSSPPVGSPPAG